MKSQKRPIPTQVVIVGAGLTGATLAERMAAFGAKVTIYEKRNHIGGNCFDFMNQHGIRIHKYGPHFFHTNNEKVWEYVNRFSQFYNFELRVRGTLEDGKTFPVPVNIETVQVLYPDSKVISEEDMKSWIAKNTISCSTPQNSKQVALARVGQGLYEKIFLGYTQKQWEKSPEDLDSSVLARIPVRTDFEDRYFTDKYQALPLNGYTQMIEKMLCSPNIQVCLEQDWCTLDESQKPLHDLLIFTGPIDQYFQHHNLEKLEYRSLRFEQETLEVSKYQETPLVTYPNVSTPWTRIVEYKHLMKESPNVCRTTIVKEFSSSVGDPYYPVPNSRNHQIYAQYQKLAEEEEKRNIFFVGRLANYKYFNMDQAILNALEFFEREFET